MKGLDFKKDIKIDCEPLLHSIMYARQLSILLTLKKKARILVAESAVLMGVVDEEGILEENEVFVQIKRDNYKVDNALGQNSQNKDQDKRSNKDVIELISRIDQMEYIVESDVLVTRNPC